MPDNDQKRNSEPRDRAEQTDSTDSTDLSDTGNASPEPGSSTTGSPGSNADSPDASDPDSPDPSEPDSAETQAEKELEILRHISERESVHQRDLARVVGMSLGMTNAILKRLSRKGLLTIRKVNNRNIRYAVTPDGMEAIARRSYRYFRRTIKNVVYYKDAIEELILEINRQGFVTVMLVGASDMDFIVEHLCWKYGLAMVRRADGEADGQDVETDTFVLHSERKPVPPRRASRARFAKADSGQGDTAEPGTPGANTAGTDSTAGTGSTGADTARPELAGKGRTGADTPESPRRPGANAQPDSQQQSPVREVFLREVVTA